MDLISGKIIIRRGKGQKGRIGFISPTVISVLSEYLALRTDSNESLFLSARKQRLTYDGLRQMLERRVIAANLQISRSLHDFRRAFALNMLRNGVDIYALQLLMGHSDLTVLRRYLAQNENDLLSAHKQGSPVESLFRKENLEIGGNQ